MPIMQNQNCASGCVKWWRAKASRRQFVRTMLGLGLSAPFVANLLATYTPAAAQGACHAVSVYPHQTRWWRQIAPVVVASPDDCSTRTVLPEPKTTMPHESSTSH
jgi:hypothetical protein